MSMPVVLDVFAGPSAHAGTVHEQDLSKVQGDVNARGAVKEQPVVRCSGRPGVNVQGEVVEVGAAQCLDLLLARGLSAV